MKLIIMRGLPGSGKSTLVKNLYHDADIFSTDNYWLRPDGTYDFNVKLLGKAHEWNFNCFSKWVHTGFSFSNVIGCSNIAVIDNTNITFKEFEKYVVLAQENNIEIDIVEPATAWAFNAEECFKRNKHGVPLETIQRMLSRWESIDDIWKQIGK